MSTFPGDCFRTEAEEVEEREWAGDRVLVVYKWEAEETLEKVKLSAALPNSNIHFDEG